LRLDAEFVTSAATAGQLPRDGTPEIALIGRSNVGKSTLINALVRQRLARTSGAPGKTRLANIYRVAGRGGAAFYLVDLPGFGFARGKREELETVVREYFGRDEAAIAALLLVDARHPGLASDLDAWKWLQAAAANVAIVATKIDKLSRSERQRAMRTNDAVFEHPVLPVSAATGEGLDELWKLIDRLLSSRPAPPPLPRSLTPSRTAAPGPPPPRRRHHRKNSNSRR
jgi:GTP-binding protein